MPAAGYKQSAEARARIATARRQYWADVRAGRRESRAGQHMRPEEVERIRRSLLAKGDAASSKRPEVRAKLSRAHGGKSKKQTQPEATLHAVLNDTWHYIGSGYLADGSVNTRYDGRLNVPVGADFVNFASRTLVFLDGCYWHECPEHGSGRFPNKPAKDKVLRDQARQCGWDVVAVWEHDVRTDATRVAQLLERTGKNGRNR